MVFSHLKIWVELRTRGQFILLIAWLAIIKAIIIFGNQFCVAILVRWFCWYVSVGVEKWQMMDGFFCCILLRRPSHSWFFIHFRNKFRFAKFFARRTLDTHIFKSPRFLISETEAEIKISPKKPVARIL